MKVLVTGGAGFIGSHVVDALLSKNHQVVVVDNLLLGKTENIEHHFNNLNFKFIEEDLNIVDKIDELFAQEKFELVIHLAANSDIAQSFENPSIDLNNTFNTTFNLLNSMKKHSVKKLVFASTSAIYGDTKDQLHENFGPLIPVSHYGAGKLASEAFIYSFAANYDIQSWIVRFPNVVGERATHGIIFDFINKLNKNSEQLEVLGDGNQYKPYMYVKDLVNAIFYVFENSNDHINIYNLGVDTRIRVRDIAAMVIEQMGLNAQIKYTGGNRGWIGDVPEFNYDLTKINQLGFKVSKSSNEAVLTAIKYILGK